MALKNPESGLGHVGEYEVSGVVVTGVLTSAGGMPGQTVTFTKVTKAKTFNDADQCTGNGQCDISFDGGATTFKFGAQVRAAGAANNAHRVEVKCTSLMNVNTSGANKNIQFIAELTNIDADECPDWDFADYCSIT